MLHRSFKPAKCKTSLKLASSRLKLMKNKKEVQLKQMKKELAQLLESGQDQTARIRVEHVVREEKTIAAYELLELYSELIVARLSIIESQKNCPIDLKEAVTSLIFASPRCADIPELMDIRKHFAGKYGKEFVSAAVELRPECGVSRMLVEKLSAKAPDGQTKLKILSAIAEEHNIKWDPTTFGEKELKPPNDLLNGPNTFQSASNTQPEHPIVQVPPSNVQVHPSRDQKNNAPLHFEHNVSSSASPQNFTSTDIGGGQATMPATSHPGMRPSGTGSERMEVRHAYSKDGNAFPMDRQNWNMEFTDATAAAQAAAESAERASMAARAAAELSSRGKITRQYSTESQKSNTHSLRNEGPRKEAASKLPTDRFAKDSGYQDRKQTKEGPRKDAASKLPTERFAKDSGYQDRKQTEEGPRKDAASKLPTERFANDSGYQYRKQTEEVDRNKHDDPDEAVERFYRDGYGDIKRSSRSASLRSSAASIDEDELMNDLQKADRYSRKSSFEEEVIETEKSAYLSGMNMKKHSIGSEVELESNWQGGRQSDNLDYFGEERIKRQPSSVTPISHSSNRGNDYDISPSSHQNFGIDLGEDPSIGFDQGNIHGDTTQTSFYNNDAVFFDQYGSDDDDSRFDTFPKYDGPEPKLFAMSPGRESPAHLSANADTWSPRQNLSGSLEKSSSELHVSAEWHSPPEFDESLTKSAQPSQPDDSLSVAFDESDVPSSESEDELDKSRIGGKTDSSFLAHEENIFSRNPDDIHDESHRLTGSFRVQKGDSASNRRQDLRYSSDEKELVEESVENKYGTEFSAQSRRKFSFDEVPTHQSSSSHTKSQMASNDSSSNRKQDLHYYSHDEELVDDSTERNQGTKFSAQSRRKFVFDEEPTPQSSSRFTKSQMASNDSASNREQDLDYSSHDEELVEVRAERNQGAEFIAPSRRKFGFDEMPNRQLSSRRTKSQIASNDSPSNRKQDPHYSSSDELVEVRAGKNQGTESSVLSRRKSNFDEVPNRQSSSRRTKSQIASNDTNSGTFYNPVEGEKREQSRQSSRLSSFNEAKATNNTLTPESPDSVKDDELFDQSSSESGKELKFGTLTGGLRNKGYRRPPYTRSPPGESLSSKTAAEESVTATKPSHSLGSPAVDSSLNSGGSTKVESKSSSRASITRSDLDTTDSEEELPQQNSRNKREPYSSKAAKEEVNTKSRFGAPVTYFDFDEDESVDLPKNNSTSTGRGGSAISRRTKPTPSTRTSSYSKATVGSEASINSDADAKQRSSRNSFDSETPQEPRLAANSGRGRNSPEPSSATQATYNPIPESKISLRGETLKSSAFEKPSSPLKTVTSSASSESWESKFSLRGDSSVIEKPSSSLKTATSSSTEKRESKFSLPGESLKSSAIEKPSNPLRTTKSASNEKRESKFSITGESLKPSTIEKPSRPLKTATSASTESPKTSASQPPSRESSLNKPSHVHPKLPDFDTIAALLQSHRSNIK